MTLELNPPHKLLLDENMTSAMALCLPLRGKGRFRFTAGLQEVGHDGRHLPFVGNMPSMTSCALCSLAEATIFMADVIFSVLLAESILPFTSFNDAMV